jgi:type IV secretory pathway VirB10-like protein
MTTAAPELAPAAPIADPHAPKLSPDDPRLRLRRPAARTLRTGPLVALTACLLGAVMLAVAFAFQAPSSAGKTKPDQATGATPTPVVPESIRNAPAEKQTTIRPDAGWPRGEMAARGPRLEDPTRRLEQEQDLKARGAEILFETAGAAPEGSPAAQASRPTPLGSSAPPPSGSGPFGADSDPNLQDRKNAFLDGQGSAKTTDYLVATLQHPRSPYELKAGTIIPTVLITAINSDLPGPVIGQVRENVYDTATGNYLLVPQGSRLLAHYDSMVAWGQERVLVCWNRLILPNGDSINLQCMPAADLQGAAGLTDQVDEHWFRLIKGAAVASLLAATTQAVAGNTDGFNPTVPQVWARNGASEINQVGQQLTRRNMSIQPTITVRPGFSVNVIVTKDMVVPPYSDAPAAMAGRP